MAAIRALLNPTTASNSTSSAPASTTFLPRTPTPTPTPTPQLLSPSTTTSTSTPSPSTFSPRKRPRIAKDLPVFTPSSFRGTIRYPPYSYPNNTALPAYHTQFSVYPPADKIGDYPRHIPYNSEKKVFADKMGRDYFEVLQYTFKVPGEAAGDSEFEGGKTYTILWDYNVGLVRGTPLFKCCGYGKTTPAKMLNRNEGLREICHSITGGALVAQGYWIPYAAARAIAKTFCYSIRHALTPVFGIEFIDDCIHPDSKEFGVMMIDPTITVECTALMQEYRKHDVGNGGKIPATLGSPLNIQRHLPKPLKIHGFKAINALHKHVHASDTSSSGYSTESSNNDDEYALSPTSPSPVSPRFKNSWKMPFAPRSTPRCIAPRTTPRLIEEEAISPKTFTDGGVKVKKGYFDAACQSMSPDAAVSPKTKVELGKRVLEIDEEYDAGTSSDEMGDVVMTGEGREECLRYHGGLEKEASEGTPSEEEEAAKVLLSLGSKHETAEPTEAVVGLGLWGVKKIAKRRASA